jgi:N-methylhydantoinase A
MLTGADSRLGTALQEVAVAATDRFTSMFRRSPGAVALSVDARYRGQSHELEVGADDRDGVGLTARFHRSHRERFGFDRPGEEVEIVNVRAVATGVAPVEWGDLPSISGTGSAIAVDGIWERDNLPAGLTLDGPAVVVEDNSATLLGEGDHLEVLSDGSLRIEVR